MAVAATKEHAHELIERIPESQLGTAIDMLEKMADPLAYALANAPWEDELISPEEEAAAARARAESSPGLSMEEVLAELGFTSADLEAFNTEADVKS